MAINYSRIGSLSIDQFKSAMKFIEVYHEPGSGTTPDEKRAYVVNKLNISVGNTYIPRLNLARSLTTDGKIPTPNEAREIRDEYRRVLTERKQEATEKRINAEKKYKNTPIKDSSGKVLYRSAEDLKKSREKAQKEAGRSGFWGTLSRILLGVAGFGLGNSVAGTLATTLFGGVASTAAVASLTVIASLAGGIGLAIVGVKLGNLISESIKNSRDKKLTEIENLSETQNVDSIQQEYEDSLAREKNLEDEIGRLFGTSRDSLFSEAEGTAYEIEDSADDTAEADAEEEVAESESEAEETEEPESEKEEAAEPESEAEETEEPESEKEEAVESESEKEEAAESESEAEETEEPESEKEETAEPESEKEEAAESESEKEEAAESESEKEETAESESEKEEAAESESEKEETAESESEKEETAESESEAEETEEPVTSDDYEEDSETGSRIDDYWDENDGYDNDTDSRTEIKTTEEVNAVGEENKVESDTTENISPEATTEIKATEEVNAVGEENKVESDTTENISPEVGLDDARKILGEAYEDRRAARTEIQQSKADGIYEKDEKQTEKNVSELRSKNKKFNQALKEFQIARTREIQRELVEKGEKIKLEDALNKDREHFNSLSQEELKNWIEYYDNEIPKAKKDDQDYLKQSREIASNCIKEKQFDEQKKQLISDIQIIKPKVPLLQLSPQALFIWKGIKQQKEAIVSQCKNETELTELRAHIEKIIDQISTYGHKYEKKRAKSDSKKVEYYAQSGNYKVDDERNIYLGNEIGGVLVNNRKDINEEVLKFYREAFNKMKTVAKQFGHETDELETAIKTLRRTKTNALNNISIAELTSLVENAYQISGKTLGAVTAKDLNSKNNVEAEERE